MTRQTCLASPAICAASAVVSLTPGGSTNSCWTRASERLFETPCLERLRHERCSSQLLSIPAFCVRARSGRQALCHPAHLAAAASGAVEVSARLPELEPAPPGATTEAGDSTRSLRSS